MKQISASTSEVLTKLKENRSKHVEAFNKAEDGWLEAARLVLTVRLARVKDCLAKEFKGDAPDLNFFELENDKPRCYVEDYDTAIAMLELHQEDQITLSAQDVSSYVLDQWGWKETFSMSNTKYSR